MSKKLSHAFRAFFIVAAVLIQMSRIYAAWGDLDTSFGFQGAAIDTVTGYHPRGIAVQPDGKILVTGYRTSALSGERFFLRRYLSNGSLDTAFGTNGAAIGPETNSISTDYRGDTLIVLANGKIAVSGWANRYNAVWQFLSNGKPDKTFAETGLLVLTNYPVNCSTSPGMNTGYPEMQIQSGKFLLSLGKGNGDNCRVALVRITAAGAIDSHFGNAGESLTGVSGGYRGFGTAVGPAGEITVGGGKFGETNYKVLEQKLENGQDDPMFISTPFYYASQIIQPGLVRTSNGRFIKRWGDLGSSYTVLEKFGPNGLLERNLTGYPVDPAGCPDIFTAQNDGKVLTHFAGTLFRADAQFTPALLERTGCPNLAGLTDLARAALQPDDKMIAAGVYNNYLMLVRLLPN